MIGDKTPCKVIPMKNGLHRIGRRGVPAAPSGIMLYYLWHEETGLYLKECYVDEAYAIHRAAITLGPRSMGDVAESWCADMKHCFHSYRTGDPE